MNRAIVILNRLNASGFDSKTRIGKAVNSQNEANRFSEYLLEMLINNIKEFKGDIFIYYPNTPELESVFKMEIAGRKIECLQEKDYGSILTHISDAMQVMQKRDYQQIICTVSDVPYLHLEYFTQIFELLDKYDVVLGPAIDGGINVFAVHENSQLNWINSENEISRTENYHLLKDIENNLKNLHISYAVIEKKYNDIDTLEDVKEFYNYINDVSNKIQYNADLINMIEKWIFV